MKTKFKYLLSFLLCAILLASLTLIPSAASEEVKQWEISPDGNTITDGSYTYTYYESYNQIHIATNDTIYIYRNSIREQNGIYNDVYIASSNPEVIWLNDGYTTYSLYATKDGLAKIQSFLDGKDRSYMLYEGNNRRNHCPAPVITDLKTAYSSQSDTVEMEVSELKSLKKYDIRALDQSKTFSYNCGIIYKLADGSLAYIDFDALDNSYFDSEGNFSYRRGKVKLAVLDADLSMDVKDVIEGTERFSPYFESADIDESEEHNVPIALFWVVYSLLGFIIPTVLLILGIAYANRKKWNKPKYWYILSYIAASWILLAIILMILLLI